MRSSLLLVGSLTALLLAAGTAQGQHSAAASAAVSPEYSRCGMCHSAHPGGPGAYALRTDDLPVIVGRTPMASGGPGKVSLSCLRCHLTPEVRAAQPDFQGAGISSLLDSKYLGLDLGDDHPVGLVEASAWPDPSARADVPPSDPFGAEIRRLIGGVDARAVECTTCHDPHDPAGSIPGPEEQVRICTSCHEPLTYAVQDHPSLACSDCHSLHSGYKTALLTASPDEGLCNACHDPIGPPAAARSAGRVLKGPEGHVQPPDESCLTCHAPHR